MERNTCATHPAVPGRGITQVLQERQGVRRAEGLAAQGAVAVPQCPDFGGVRHRPVPGPRHHGAVRSGFQQQERSVGGRVLHGVQRHHLELHPWQPGHLGQVRELSAQDSGASVGPVEDGLLQDAGDQQVRVLVEHLAAGGGCADLGVEFPRGRRRPEGAQHRPGVVVRPQELWHDRRRVGVPAGDHRRRGTGGRARRADVLDQFGGGRQHASGVERLVGAVEEDPARRAAPLLRRRDRVAAITDGLAQLGLRQLGPAAEHPDLPPDAAEHFPPVHLPVRRHGVASGETW